MRSTSARLTVLFPLTWFVFTLVRGWVVDWYPYPFIDVSHLGDAEVALDAVWIGLLVLAVAAGATALDARLDRPTPEVAAP